MVTRKAKTGRPIGFFRMMDGTWIDGLIKLKDGRWRVSGAGKVTFTEHDEIRAVQRAQDIMAKRKGSTKLLVPMGTFVDGHEAGKAIAEAMKGNAFVARIPLGNKPVTVKRSFDTAEAWAYFAETVLNNPAYAAKRSGIECLAWLPDIKKPAPSPTLEEVGKSITSGPTSATRKRASAARRGWSSHGQWVSPPSVTSRPR